MTRDGIAHWVGGGLGAATMMVLNITTEGAVPGGFVGGAIGGGLGFLVAMGVMSLFPRSQPPTGADPDEKT